MTKPVGKSVAKAGAYAAVATETPSKAPDVVHGQRAVTPLPKWKIAAVIAVQMNEGINITSLFPYMTYMVQDFGTAQKDVGFYVGVLSASFCAAQFVSASFWGWMSDVAGRKRTLCYGLLGTMLAVLAFGFSGSFPQALAARILAGLLNGNVGVLKALLSDITDDSNRAKAFSTLSLAFGMGSIIGPAFGGALARPHMQYPDMSWGIFEDLPYLLPALCSAGFLLVSVMLAACMLDNDRPDASCVDVVKRLGTACGRFFGRLALPCCRQRTTRYASLELSAAAGSTAAARTGSGDDDDTDDGGPVGSDDDDADDDDAVNATSETKTAGDNAAHTDVMKAKPVTMSIAAYAVLAFMFICLDELTPLWATAPESIGGMGMSSRQVGVVLMLGGVSIIVYNTFGFPIVARRMTYKRLYVSACTVGAAFFVATPAAGYLESAPPALFWAALVATQVIRMSLAVTAFTAVMIMVNNSVPTSHMGRVNGVAQSFAALARAVGPAVAGASWSLLVRLDFPGHAFAAFAIVSLMSCVAAHIGSRLPDSLQYKMATTSTESRDQDTPTALAHV